MSPDSAGNMTIRPAATADVGRITEIYNHYVVNTPVTFDLEPVTLEERLAWFKEFAPAGLHRLFVAESEGMVVGYAGSLQYRTKRAYDTTVETTIYCAPGFTGRGIGSQLYTALFQSIAGEDLRMAVAGITLPNPVSLKLHERFGFSSAGVLHRVGRKFGRYWDVAWFEKPLEQERPH